MDLVGNGVSVFHHNHLAVGPGSTADINYAGWQPGRSMPITFTLGSRVQSRQTLSDEPNLSDTGGQFAPTEPSPSPSEPQPPPRSTRLSFDCSPSQLAVGETTTCTATVTDTGSGTPSTPTGTVTFTSDSPGDFSGNPCTLGGAGPSAGCSVTYMPTAPGSGTHGITATYNGDSTHSSGSG